MRHSDDHSLCERGQYHPMSDRVCFRGFLPDAALDPSTNQRLSFRPVFAPHVEQTLANGKTIVEMSKCHCCVIRPTLKGMDDDGDDGGDDDRDPIRRKAFSVRAWQVW